MLDFSDKPYRFFPPRRFAPAAWLLTQLNRWARLPRTKRVVSLDVTGGGRLDPLRGPAHRVIFLPNHPSHADPEIMLEALRRVGIAPRFMAAYDIFLRALHHRWAMQLMGAFSVDREGSDPRAMSEAGKTIAAGRYPLVLFPEGNVYLQNDVVTPFHDGAAFLALKAAKELAPAARVWAVPVSIKLTHLGDARAKAQAKLDEVADAVGAGQEGGPGALERLRAVGLAALRRNLKHRGLPAPEGADLPAVIRAAAGTVLDDLERKLGVEARPKDDLLERVRRARRTIHQIRLDEARAADAAAAVVWADAAMLAFRIASYGGDYVARNPTLDRWAETVEKLAEDVFGRPWAPFGPRHAFVAFHEPIDVTAAGEEAPKLRAAVAACTERVEGAAQAGVDALNAENPHPGGRIRVG